MELAGTADTAELSGNRALTCIPPGAKASVIIFEDRGTIDKVIATRNAGCGQVQRVCAPGHMGSRAAQAVWPTHSGPWHLWALWQQGSRRAPVSAASKTFLPNWLLSWGRLP